MDNNNTIPAELQEEILNKANNYSKSSQNPFVARLAHVAGATEYAIWKLKYDELEQWKREALLVMNPILDYGQSHPDIKLGTSITSFVIERCKQYDELKAENERIREDFDRVQRTAISYANRKRELEQQRDEAVREHAALKERAEKMHDCLIAVLMINQVRPLHDADLVDDINTALQSWNQGKGGGNEK